MALVGALHSVGDSVVQHLTGALAIARAAESGVPVPQRVLPTCTFSVVSGSTLNTNFSPGSNQVTLYLFRVGQDRTMRSASDPRFPGDPVARPLSLELYFLLTVWASDSREEQTLLAWTMLELEKLSPLDRSVLTPARHWREDESVQMQMIEMGHEDMMRIWEALQPDYRLSVAYIARPVRIETGRHSDSSPVIATRFELEELDRPGRGEAADA